MTKCRPLPVYKQPLLASAAEAKAQSEVDERYLQPKKHQVDVEQLRARADGFERHQLGQIDDLRGQHIRATNKQENELAAEGKFISDRQAFTQTANAELETQRKEQSASTPTFPGSSIGVILP